MQIKTLHVEFTTKCNSRCKMCDYWRVDSQQTVSSELVFRTVAELVPNGLKKIYFTGGECLLVAEELFCLCMRIRTAFPLIDLGLMTNGILLMKYHHDVGTLFSKVIISLDTINPQIYQKIRGVDSLHQVREGVHMLKEKFPQTQVNLRTLVLCENTWELPDIIEYALREQVTRVSFFPEDTSSKFAFGRSIGTKMANRRQEISLPALRTVIEQIRTKYAAEFGGLLPRGCDDLDYVYAVYAGDFECVRKCNRALYSIIMRANGFIGPCFFIDGKYSISETCSIMDILGDEEYGKLIADIASCRYPVCYTCACPKELS